MYCCLWGCVYRLWDLARCAGPSELCFWYGLLSVLRAESTQQWLSQDDQWGWWQRGRETTALGVSDLTTFLGTALVCLRSTAAAICWLRAMSWDIMMFFLSVQQPSLVRANNLMNCCDWRCQNNHNFRSRKLFPEKINTKVIVSCTENTTTFCKKHTSQSNMPEINTTGGRTCFMWKDYAVVLLYHVGDCIVISAIGNESCIYIKKYRVVQCDIPHKLWTQVYIYTYIYIYMYLKHILSHIVWYIYIYTYICIYIYISYNYIINILLYIYIICIYPLYVCSLVTLYLYLSLYCNVQKCCLSSYACIATMQWQSSHMCYMIADIWWCMVSLSGPFPVSVSPSISEYALYSIYIYMHIFVYVYNIYIYIYIYIYI